MKVITANEIISYLLIYNRKESSGRFLSCCQFRRSRYLTNHIARKFGRELNLAVWWFGGLLEQPPNSNLTKFLTRTYIWWSCTEPLNLNPPICLHWQFGTQWPNLIPTNISSYAVIHILLCCVPMWFIIIPLDEYKSRLLPHNNNNNYKSHERAILMPKTVTFRVLPRKNLMHSGWAWFGQSLWPHQSFWLQHQKNMDIEGGAAMLIGPGVNTNNYGKGHFTVDPPNNGQDSCPSLRGCPHLGDAS